MVADDTGPIRDMEYPTEAEAQRFAAYYCLDEVLRHVTITHPDGRAEVVDRDQARASIRAYDYGGYIEGTTLLCRPCYSRSWLVTGNQSGNEVPGGVCEECGRQAERGEDR